MKVDARLGRQRGRHLSTLKAHEIHVARVDGQREGVILHSGASAQIAQNHDHASHVSPYLLSGLVAAAAAFLVTPFIGRGAAAIGLVDAPGGRKVHAQPVPRLGGLAIAGAAGMAALFVPHGVPLASAWPLAAGGLLVFAAGTLDDVRSLPALVKLVVETLAAAVVMASGLLIERVTLGGATIELGAAAWPITWLWIVGLTNAFNLIDGLDGLAAGVAAIAGAACTAILIRRGHAAEALLLASLVGAALGFLAHNFPPASIFLGDGGSLLFGFVLATTALAGWQKGATALAAGVPLLIFLLPIADTAAALARRLLARPDAARGFSLVEALARVVVPDRLHIHHRLLSLGWSARGTVLLLYLVTLVLSLVALATARFD